MIKKQKGQQLNQTAKKETQISQTAKSEKGLQVSQTIVNEQRPAYDPAFIRSMVSIYNFSLRRLFNQDFPATIRLLNRSQRKIVFKLYSSISTIKQQIFKKLSQSLQTQQMALTHLGKVLTDKATLSDLVTFGNQQIILQQQKAELHVQKIPELTVQINGKDQTTGETGIDVAVMSCGHKIGVRGMQSWLKELIQTRSKCMIYCAQQSCKKQWDFKVCKAVAVLTSEQAQNLECKLRKNYQDYQNYLKTIKVMVSTKLLNGLLHQREFSLHTSVLDIKRFIFEHLSQSLRIQQMALYRRDKTLKDSLQLVDIVEGEANVVLQQRKAELRMIPGLLVQRGQDAISGQIDDLAVMPCQHDQLPLCIHQFISISFYHIITSFVGCSFYIEGQLQCLMGFSVMQKKQAQQFQGKMNQNYFKVQCKECPKCRAKITKNDLKTDRVACAICKYGDFCYSCLNYWRGTNYCGNQECNIANYLSQSTQPTIFQLYNPNGQLIICETPSFRFCPTCNFLIEHVQDCKHMTCENCRTAFCWVCLSLKDRTTGVWPCRGAYHYCGRIEPQQQIPRQC